MRTSFHASRVARYLASLLLGLASLAGIVGCSSGSHTTEVVLPGGYSCRSETGGSFFNRTRDMQCVDSTGKVIGAYKSY
jgi:hypothetical protein